MNTDLEWQRKTADHMLAMYVGKIEDGKTWPSIDECWTMVQAYGSVGLLSSEEQRQWDARIKAVEEKRAQQ